MTAIATSMPMPAPTVPPAGGSRKKRRSPLYKLSFELVLEDLAARFVVNLPASELGSMERIYFQCEQAHWFYEDFVRPANQNLSTMKLRVFSFYLLKTASQVVPLIQQYISSQQGDLNAAFDSFMKYKLRVPVCGAILLNQTWDKVLLVKGWKSPTWTFPKGKINQDEAELLCAVREVHEETGYDCGPILAKSTRPDGSNDDYIDVKLKNGHKIRLYVAPGVDDTFPFKTLTRKEISRIGWLSLRELPSNKNGSIIGVREERTPAGQKFYHVAPFVRPLREWIKANRASHPMRPPQSAAPAEDDTEWAAEPSAAEALPPGQPDLDVGGDTSYLSAREEPDASASHSAAAEPHLLTSILGIPVSTSSVQPPPLPNPSQPQPTSAPARPSSSSSQALLSILQPPQQAPAAHLAPSPYSPACPPAPGSDATLQPNAQSQALLNVLSGPPSGNQTAAPAAGFPPYPAGPAASGPAPIAPHPAQNQAQALLGILSPPPAAPAPRTVPTQASQAFPPSSQTQMQAPAQSQAQALLGILSPPRAPPAAGMPHFPHSLPPDGMQTQTQNQNQNQDQDQRRALWGLLQGAPHASTPTAAPAAPPNQAPTQAQTQSQALLGLLSASAAPAPAAVGAPQTQTRPAAPQRPWATAPAGQATPVPNQQQALLGLLGSGPAPGPRPVQAHAPPAPGGGQDLLRTLFGGA